MTRQHHRTGSACCAGTAVLLALAVLFLISACAPAKEAPAGPTPEPVQLEKKAEPEPVDLERKKDPVPVDLEAEREKEPPAETLPPEAEPTPEPTPEPSPTQAPGALFYLNEEKASVHGGGSVELEAFIDSDKTESETVRWSSSDEDVLIVDEYGVAVGLKKGNAVVTADANDGTGRTAECKIRVTSDRPKQKSSIYYGGNCFAGTKKLDNAESRHVRKYVEGMDDALPGTKIVKDTLHYVSYPYGTDPKQIDCSMLLLYAALDSGIRIPRQSDKQARFLKKWEIPLEQLEPGDFVYFAYPEDVECSCSTAPVCKRYMRIHHCAVYLGETRGLKYFAEASSRVGRVCIRRWDGTPDYVGFRIVFCARLQPDFE